jgi:hypothetical protein
MRTLAVLIAGLALVAGCGEDDEPAEPQGSFADLVIVVDADGKGGEAAERRTLFCETKDDAPCDALTAAVFEPTPPETACTQQFGGPQTATVTGTFDGREVDARYSRANGCEIARWEKAAPLLGA